VRRLLTTVLVSCALLLAGWVAAPPASACSCAGGSTAGHLQRADAVFTGTLLSREVHHPAGGLASSADPAVHVFAVEAIHKGTAEAEQQVVSADSGASCGLELAGDGPFLVFATDPAGAPEGQLAADLCGGTAPLTPALAAEVHDLTGAGPAPPGPEAPLPGPLPEPAPIGMAAEGASAGTAWALVLGTALLTLLAGALVVRSRRRAARPTTVLVLTRD